MRFNAGLILLTCIVTTLPSTGSATDEAMVDKSATEDRAVEFVRIWPQWRTADSFLRISEYFGGEENTGKETMLRTQPENRTGFYFLTRTRNEGLPLADAKFVLEIIKPDSPRTITYTFPAKLPNGGHVFNLGLTGKDWPNKDTQPVAWRIRLLDVGEHELASSQSFLWRLPDSTAP